MKKVKAIFVVERSVQMVTRKIESSNQWVFDNEGEATIKYDGTPALIKDGVLYKRWNRKLQKKFIRRWKSDKNNFDATLDKFVPVPDGAIQLEDLPAPITLHFPYWVPVSESNHDDLKFIDAFNALKTKDEGSYELIGKKIQGNKYNLDVCKLVKHGAEVVEINDMSFDGLRQFFANLNHEGIVWHHPDGRMAKLRRSHFNFDWKEDVRNDSEARANFVP
ncbi:DUF5565 family protein [Vibrio splendidus]|nr:DUF5565 family protein [Vibrio splendidus]MCC4880537.1 DUF5565 family protein [Vibrio splendidus]